MYKKFDILQIYNNRNKRMIPLYGDRRACNPNESCKYSNRRIEGDKSQSVTNENVLLWRHFLYTNSPSKSRIRCDPSFFTKVVGKAHCGAILRQDDRR